MASWMASGWWRVLYGMGMRLSKQIRAIRAIRAIWAIRSIRSIRAIRQSGLSGLPVGSVDKISSRQTQ